MNEQGTSRERVWRLLSCLVCPAFFCSRKIHPAHPQQKGLRAAFMLLALILFCNSVPAQELGDRKLLRTGMDYAQGINGVKQDRDEAARYFSLYANGDGSLLVTTALVFDE